MCSNNFWSQIYGNLFHLMLIYCIWIFLPLISNLQTIFTSNFHPADHLSIVYCSQISQLIWHVFKINLSKAEDCSVGSWRASNLTNQLLSLSIERNLCLKTILSLMTLILQIYRWNFVFNVPASEFCLSNLSNLKINWLKFE